MEVILLERVAKLGQMGEVVRVKDGFARNFLLKRGKALRATSDNRAKFDGMKAELEARNLQAKGEASKVAEKIDGRNVVVLRQASETGQLFGSVTVRDIIASFESDGVTISRSQIMLDAPIKSIGKHNIAIAVHPEVEVSVTVTVVVRRRRLVRTHVRQVVEQGRRRAGQPGDLLLLRSQVGACIFAAFAGRLAGRLELSPGAFGEGLGAHGRERVERGPQLVAGIDPPVLPAQPFAVDQAGAGQVGRHPGSAQQLDRLAVLLFGGTSPGYQRPGPRRRPASPVAGARHG